MNRKIITPYKSWKLFFKELWDYREVFIFLGLRDLLVQYRQTVIGILWVALRPLITVFIFTIVFGRLAHFTSKGVPYFLIIFSGMLVWQLFADIFNFGSSALLSNTPLLTKIYFPRIMLPTSRIICALLDFFIMFALFAVLGLMWGYSIFSFRLLLLPLFLFLNMVFALSITVLFSALIVTYRDFRHLIPFILQVGLYVSPIGFQSDVIEYKWRLLLSLNPLMGIVDSFRWIFFGFPFPFVTFSISFLSIILLTGISLCYFKNVESTFPDII